MAKEVINYLNEIEEEDMAPQVCVLFKAMNEIGQNPKLVTDTDNSNNIVIERNYAISLAYQLGRFSIDKSDFFPFSETVLIGGDLNKYIDANIKEIVSSCRDLDFKIKDNRFEVLPDIIVHESHNPNSVKQDGQYLAVDIKSREYLGIVPFEKDFFKLNCYLTSLNYKYAIYMILNTNKTRVNERIKQYIDSHLFVIKERLNDLLFFIQDDIYSAPKAYVIDYTLL